MFPLSESHSNPHSTTKYYEVHIFFPFSLFTRPLPNTFRRRRRRHRHRRSQSSYLTTPPSFSLLPPFSPFDVLKKETMAAAAKDLVRKPVMATVRLRIPAGAARPGPPVGAILGQLKLNMMAFCKDFNAKTQKYKPDTPMAVSLIAYKDRTFDYVIKSPTVSWFLKQAAGLESGSGRPGHVFASSAISLKHVYEIAAVKKNDPGCQHLELDSICKSILGTAKSMGIKVVKELD